MSDFFDDPNTTSETNLTPDYSTALETIARQLHDRALAEQADLLEIIRGAVREGIVTQAGFHQEAFGELVLALHDIANGQCILCGRRAQIALKFHYEAVQ